MAGHCRVPNESQAGYIGFNDDRMQLSAVVNTVLEEPVKIGTAPEYEPWKAETKGTLLPRVENLNLFAAPEVRHALLITRGTLEEAIIEIFREDRHSLLLPFDIIGAGKSDARRPVRWNRAKASGNVSGWVGSILNVGGSFADEAGPFLGKPGADGVGLVESLDLQLWSRMAAMNRGSADISVGAGRSLRPRRQKCRRSKARFMGRLPCS